MKKRYNFTLSKEAVEILKQAKKLSKKSKSLLVDVAIKETYKNKKEYLKEKARAKIKEINQIRQQIKDLEVK